MRFISLIAVVTVVVASVQAREFNVLSALAQTVTLASCRHHLRRSRRVRRPRRLQVRAVVAPHRRRPDRRTPLQRAPSTQRHPRRAGVRVRAGTDDVAAQAPVLLRRRVRVHERVLLEAVQHAGQWSVVLDGVEPGLGRVAHVCGQG